MNALVGWGVGGVGRVRDIELGPDYGHVCRLCRRSNPVLFGFGGGSFFFFRKECRRMVSVRFAELWGGVELEMTTEKPRRSDV